MIAIDKEKVGLIFQDIFIMIRSRASNGADPQIFADIADRAEYLGGLVAEPEDKTDVFKRNLKELSEIYGCKNIMRVFENGV